MRSETLSGDRTLSAEDRPSTEPPTAKSPIGRTWWLIALASLIVPWLSQPPLAWWPLAAVAVTPLLVAATRATISRRQYAVLYLAGAAYWALTLQGLRFANPLIYPCWIALAAYLGIYPIAFVVALRRLMRNGVAMILAAPLAWVAIECVRNYLLTGISATMLGHTLADVPTMIQIADLGGSYAVSLVIVVVNVALIAAWQSRGKAATSTSTPTHDEQTRDETAAERPLIEKPLIGGVRVCSVVALALVSATFLYGRYRLSQPSRSSETTIALIGRNEPVEYDQDPSRELELFDAYAQESIRTFQSTERSIDAVVWPESMFTGRIPWMAGEGNGAMARELGLTEDEERAMIAEHRKRFQFRAASLQAMLATHNGPDASRPAVIGGCGVIDDGATTKMYSGIVHVGADGQVRDWYGKMHLVMFGEYIPLVKHLPMVRDWVPKNLGLTPGEHAKRFTVGGTTLCPNICIETAVERVAINHLRELNDDDQGLPDAIVTVTNDAWFDDSSVVVHHKRCAQLVAVACRRPILSAANNGPTVWIDSNGRVVDELPQGDNGCVIATPDIDSRTSLVLMIGDWPARACTLLVFAMLWMPGRHIGKGP
ncbi:apolipoprotein N-acyltransferase [Stieleria maiorica]|nr:apolipoprotein N-acyltransferase [Stieleria maiorica]